MTTYYKKIILTKNDVGNSLSLRCRIDEENFDLADYTMTFSMTKRGQTTPAVNGGSCTVTDASNGEGTYDIVAEDLDTTGVYDGEVGVTKTGVAITFRGLKIIVEDEKD